MNQLISIITPCYNEECHVKECYQRVKEIFSNALSDYRYEQIFCDNDSSDQTVALLRDIAHTDKNVKVIVNARNFGPFRSTFNGLLRAKGDAVLVMLAADLQDPPELIVDFIKKWEEGFQVVYGIRKKRQENYLMCSIRKVYYRLVNKLADINIPKDVGEFQLIDKIVLNALKRFDDYYPYIRGMIASCGFKSIGIEYTWEERKKDFSKNSFYHLIDQGLNGLISFANVPLRLCMLLGFLLSGSSILYAIFQFMINLIWFRKVAPPGIATLIVALFFFTGIQLFYLGVIGEYIGAIHFQVRRRPLVIEKELINFEE